jgi:hypothetical protein
MTKSEFLKKHSADTLLKEPKRDDVVVFIDENWNETIAVITAVFSGYVTCTIQATKKEYIMNYKCNPIFRVNTIPGQIPTIDNSDRKGSSFFEIKKLGT